MEKSWKSISEHKRKINRQESCSTQCVAGIPSAVKGNQKWQVACMWQTMQSRDYVMSVLCIVGFVKYAMVWTCLTLLSSLPHGFKGRRQIEFMTLLRIVVLEAEIPQPELLRPQTCYRKQHSRKCCGFHLRLLWFRWMKLVLWSHTAFLAAIWVCKLCIGLHTAVYIASYRIVHSVVENCIRLVAFVRFTGKIYTDEVLFSQYSCSI